MSQFVCVCVCGCGCCGFLPLLHMKRLYLLQARWEGSYAVISCEDVGCRESKQAQSRALSSIAGWSWGCLVCLAENFKWDRTRNNWIFFSLCQHFPRTSCKSLRCVDVFELEFHQSTAETFLPEQVFGVSHVDYPTLILDAY